MELGMGEAAGDGKIDAGGSGVSGISSSQVRVFVRMAPVPRDALRERLELERRVIRLEEPGGGRVSDFVFDGVLPENTGQDEVYRSVAAPLVENLMKGVNSCCLAYGQTGSGKTHSIFGTSPAASAADRKKSVRGISHRVVEEVMARVDAIKASGCAISVRASFIEIYMDNVYSLGGDATPTSSSSTSSSAAAPSVNAHMPPTQKQRPLSGRGRPTSAHATRRRPASASAGVSRSASSSFASSSAAPNTHVRPPIAEHSEPRPLEVLEDAHGNTIIRGLPVVELKSSAEAYAYIERGLRLRRTGATSMNLTSSRSHVILSLVVLRQTAPRGSQYVTSTINLVDLAGSERVKKSESEGARLREARGINASLSALGNVVRGLHRDNDKGHVHIPYRDTKLTRVLKDSLSGNSSTVLLATLFPGRGNYDECLNTLQFAASCTDLITSPRVNYQRSKGGAGRDGTSRSPSPRRGDASARESAAMRAMREELERTREALEAAHAHYHDTIEGLRKEADAAAVGNIASPAGAVTGAGTTSTSRVPAADVLGGVGRRRMLQLGSPMQKLRNDTGEDVVIGGIRGADSHYLGGYRGGGGGFSGGKKEELIHRLRGELDIVRADRAALAQELEGIRLDFAAQCARNAGEEAKRTDGMRQYRDRLRGLEEAHAAECERLANSAREAGDDAQAELARLRGANEALRRQLDEVARSDPARRKEQADYDRDVADAVEAAKATIEREHALVLRKVDAERERQVRNLKEQAEYFIAQRTEENRKLKAECVRVEADAKRSTESMRRELEYLARHCARYAKFLGKMERGEYVVRLRRTVGGEQRTLSVPDAELPRRIDLARCPHAASKLVHLFRAPGPSVFTSRAMDEADWNGDEENCDPGGTSVIDVGAESNLSVLIDDMNSCFLSPSV